MYDKSEKNTKFAPLFMMWEQSYNVIDLIMKGGIIGIVASAPMGPVGILTVQRTLNKGRWYGFATGLGAAVSDVIYAILTGLGMSVVLDFIERPTTMLYLKMAGGIMLFFFGLYTYKSKPAKMHQPSGRKGTLAHNAITGFLITLSNPLIMLLFLALFARFDFVIPDHLWEQTVGYVAIFAGALLWWMCLSSALVKVGAKVQMETMGMLNRLLGALVMAVSVVGLVLTLLE